MKHILKIILASTGILVISSCIKVLDYDIPDDEKRIVVNGIISNCDTFKVNINKSLHILDRLGLKAIDDALVQLLEDDMLVSEITEGRAGLYVSDFIPVCGHNYLIKVSVPGMKTASAGCTIPFPVSIEQVDTSTATYKSVWYQYYDVDSMIEIINYMKEMKSSIIFADPEETENYYELEATVSYLQNEYYRDEDTSYFIGNRRFSSTPSLKSNDPVVELYVSGKYIISDNSENDYYSGQKILFSDQLINGQKYKLNISFVSTYLISNDEYRDSVKVDFHLKSVTKDYFIYMQLLEKHLQVKDDPLSEPSQAYSNINDGLGILAGFSESVFSISINKP